MPFNALYPVPVACIYGTHSVDVDAVASGDWPVTIPATLFLSYSDDSGATWQPKVEFAKEETKVVDIGETLPPGFLLRFEEPYLAPSGGSTCYWGVLADVEGAVPAGHHLEYAWSGDAINPNESRADLPTQNTSPESYTATCTVSLVRDSDDAVICTASDTWSDTFSCPAYGGSPDYGSDVDYGDDATITDACEGEPPEGCTPPAPVACFDSLETIALDAVAAIDFPECTETLKFQTKTGAGTWSDAQTGIVADTEYSVAVPIADGMKGRFVSSDGTASTEIDLLICPIEPTISLRRVIRVEQPEAWPEGATCLSPEYRVKPRTNGATWGAWIPARDSGGGAALLHQNCGPISFDVSSCDVPPFSDVEVRLVDSDCDSGCNGKVTINGQYIATDLAAGAAREVTVDHSEDAVFEACEDPYIILPVPVGVRVSVLRLGVGGDVTSGSQFILLIENVGLVADGGYGGAAPDVVLNWTRTGQVAQ